MFLTVLLLLGFFFLLVVKNVIAIDSEYPLLSLSSAVDLDHCELLVLDCGNCAKQEVFFLSVLHTSEVLCL